MKCFFADIKKYLAKIKDFSTKGLSMFSSAIHQINGITESLN